MQATSGSMYGIELFVEYPKPALDGSKSGVRRHTSEIAIIEVIHKTVW